MEMNYKEKKIHSSHFIFLLSLFVLIILAVSDVSAYTEIYSNAKTISSCNFELSSYSLFFNNHNPYPVVINIQKKGTASGFLFISKNDFVLAPNQSDEVSVFVNPRFKTGTYYSNLIFTINSVNANKKMELSQKFVFTHCKTLEFIQPEQINVCYNNRTNISIKVSNLLNTSLPVEISMGRNKFTSEIKPGGNASFSLSKVYKRIGNMTETIEVKDLLTGYTDKKQVDVVVNSCGYVSLGGRISKFFIGLGHFFVRFWKYILIGIILLIILILIIFSFRRYIRINHLYKGYKRKESTPEIEIVSGEKEAKAEKEKVSNKPKKAKRPKKSKKEMIKAYYESVVMKESNWTKFNRFVREHRKILTALFIIVLIVVLFLILRFGFRGYYYNYSVFKLKNTLHRIWSSHPNSLNSTNLSSVNNSHALNYTSVNTTTNTGNVTANTTNQTYSTLSTSMSKLKQGLSSVLSSLKTWFVLYLNYILVGFVILIFLIVTFNIILKNKETFGLNKKKGKATKKKTNSRTVKSGKTTKGKKGKKRKKGKNNLI